MKIASFVTDLFFTLYGNYVSNTLLKKDFIIMKSWNYFAKKN